MDAKELIKLVIARKKPVLLSGLGAAVVVYCLGSMMLSYEARAQALIKPVGVDTSKDTQLPSLGLVSSSYMDSVRNEGLSYLSILRSRELVGRVVDELQLQRRFENRSKLGEFVKQPLRFLFYGRLPAGEYDPREKAIERTRNSIRAVLITGSSVLQLTVTNKDAELASNVANTLLDVARTYSAEQNERSTRESIAFLEGELDRIRASGVEAVAELEKLRQTHGVRSTGSFSDSIKDAATRIGLLEQRIDEYASLRILAQNSLAELEKRIAEIAEHPRWNYTINRNPQLDAYRQQLLTQQLSMATVLVDFQPGSPQVSAAEKQIEITTKAIGDELEKLMVQETFQADSNRTVLTLDLIRAQVDVEARPVAIAALEAKIDEQNQQISVLNAVSKELLGLENEILSINQTDQKIRDAIHASRMMANRGFNEFEILDTATIPKYPSINNAPLAFYVIAAFGMGVFGAIFFVLHRETDVVSTLLSKVK